MTTSPAFWPILLCVVLVVAFLRSRRSHATPQVSQRVSREELETCARVARRFFAEGGR